MHYHWLIFSITIALLAGCVSQTKQNTNMPMAPVQDISGAEPRYEPYHSGANNDYQLNGQTYQIIKDPAHFSETGFASIFGSEVIGKTTTTGEKASPYEFTASHPTLPIPSYARITNLISGRMMIVRINDRGPYIAGKNIALSQAAADRLNLMLTTRIKIDPILVSPTSTLTGPGTIGVNITKQSYALPKPPKLETHSSSSNQSTAENHTHQPALSQSIQSTKIPSTVSTNMVSQNNPANPSSMKSASVATERYFVQIGALSDQAKAATWQQSVSKKLNTPGRIQPFNNIYRVQLGPFQNAKIAEQIQNKILIELNQSSIIINTE
ncbi:endolytic peptidoglycan transglycosylase RlpA [Arsenophonus sp.]|uniref:endolytic peptidoglycan transglycosylase RlpA n=1 Tax=Arsenophonus sp. TaxID=1872640 RepID=UPI00285702E6|nr:endolytic peptidoglycan transglycosylase RlpA [Arsenophonus sp.]MDR5616722.1 endolytic peptidoglycan transglycosylase RlpA [Arsenophonus sp.]